MPVSVYSYSRSQSSSVLSQARTDTTVDYVEDSEPEREEQRLKRKNTRPKKTRVNLALPPQPLVEIIELSDTDSAQSHHRVPQTPVPLLTTGPLVVIDVSDCSQSDNNPNHDLSFNGSPSDENGHDSTVDDSISLPSIGRIIGLPKLAPRLQTQAFARDSHPPLEPAEDLNNISPPASCPAPLYPDNVSEGSGEEEEDRLKLGRFAYTAPNPPRRTVSKSASPIISQSPNVSHTPKKTKAKLPSHRFTQDFNDDELSRILKCVSCDLAWTTRKTLVQKMKHIQTCAKKNALTDQTVRTLLRKELDNLPPVASSSKSPAESVPETLLEDILKDAQKKKHVRRPQVVQTVKSVADTRHDILDKARLLLQDTRNTHTNGPASAHPAPRSSTRPTEFEMPPPTQGFTRSGIVPRNSLLDVHPADTTQAFGQSRLGAAGRVQPGIVRAGADIAAYSEVSPLTQVFTENPLGFSTTGPAMYEDVPPSTQIFAPSKFTNATGVTRRVVPLDEDEPISIHDTSEDDMGKSSPVRPTFPHISSFPSLNANPPQSSPRPTSPVGAVDHPPQPARSPSSPPVGDVFMQPPDVDVVGLRVDGVPGSHVPDDCHYDNGWNEWDRDVWPDDGGAYLHYIPEDDGAGPSSNRSLFLTNAISPSPRRGLAMIPEELSIGVAVSGAAPPSKPPAKKRGRKKKVTAAEESDDAEAVGTAGKDISQEELNAKLKEAVLNDDALHLRVLRYEPVHFDVFMKLATDLGVPAKRSGLKAKARVFLDQKAIHFYGAEPTKSRTRRIRHP